MIRWPIQLRTVWTVLIALGIITVAAAPKFRHSHPIVRCGIPVRDYQFQRHTQPAESVSAVAFLLREATTPTAPNALAPANALPIKVFQFVDPARLTIDHCTISRISVLVQQNGDWTLSLRADQNPVALDPPLVDRQVNSAEPAALFTDHLRRNVFVVNLRASAFQGLPEQGSLIGRQVVVPLAVPPFWVQRATPEYKVIHGNEPQLAAMFDKIDRVELDFSYQLEQIEPAGP